MILGAETSVTLPQPEWQRQKKIQQMLTRMWGKDNLFYCINVDAGTRLVHPLCKPVCKCLKKLEQIQHNTIQLYHFISFHFSNGLYILVKVYFLIYRHCCSIHSSQETEASQIINLSSNKWIINVLQRNIMRL